MECGEIPHHGLVLVWFVCVHGLCMLAEVVESRELLAAVASEGTFASMFAIRIFGVW